MHLQSYLETITRRIDTSTVEFDLFSVVTDLEQFIAEVKFISMLTPKGYLGDCIRMDYRDKIALAYSEMERAMDLPMEFEDRRVR